MADQKDFLSFEKLTAEIFDRLKVNPKYETVEHNVNLEGKDGPRQIDVLVKGQVGPLSVTTVVECKDIKRKLPVTFVDALHSKMQDVNANQAVLVSRSGFSRTAIQKAKRLGIVLCTAHAASSPKWAIDLAIPVLVQVYRPRDHSFQFSLKPSPDGVVRMVQFSKESATSINNKNILRFLAEIWNTGKVKPPIDGNEATYDFETECANDEMFIHDIDGNVHLLGSLTLTFKLEVEYLWGYVNEVQGAKLLKNITSREVSLIVDIEDAIESSKNFRKYTDIKDVPKANCLMAMAIQSLPNRDAQLIFHDHKPTEEEMEAKEIEAQKLAGGIPTC